MSIEFSFIFWPDCPLPRNSLPIGTLKYGAGENFSPALHQYLIGANLPLRIGAERTVGNGIAYRYVSFTGRAVQESLQYLMTIGDPGAHDSLCAPAGSERLDLTFLVAAYFFGCRMSFCTRQFNNSAT